MHELKSSGKFVDYGTKRPLRIHDTTTLLQIALWFLETCRRPVEAAVDLVLELNLSPVDFANLTRLKYLFKGLLEVGLDIPDLLNPDRHPDHVVCNPDIDPILRAEVFVRGRSWVEDEGFRITKTVKTD